MNTPDFTSQLSRQYDTLIERESVDSGSVMLAEAEALQDADTFCDWLGALCYRRSGIDVGYVPTRRPSELSDAFYVKVQDTFTAEKLLVLAINHLAWADVAMGRLADIYLQDQAERIARRAKEME